MVVLMLFVCKLQLFRIKLRAKNNLNNQESCWFIASYIDLWCSLGILMLAPVIMFYLARSNSIVTCSSDFLVIDFINSTTWEILGFVCWGFGRSAKLLITRSVQPVVRLANSWRQLSVSQPVLLSFTWRWRISMLASSCLTQKLRYIINKVI